MHPLQEKFERLADSIRVGLNELARTRKSVGEDVALMADRLTKLMADVENLRSRIEIINVRIDGIDRIQNQMIDGLAVEVDPSDDSEIDWDGDEIVSAEGDSGIDLGGDDIVREG